MRRQDFKEKYEDFLQKELGGTNPDPNDEAFQYFVLFQFEIARRVNNEHGGIPTRLDTSHAIGIALQLDTDAAYTELMQMFRGKYRWYYSQRLIAYQNLKRLYG